MKAEEEEAQRKDELAQIAEKEKLEKNSAETRYINSFGKSNINKEQLLVRIKADSILQVMKVESRVNPGLVIEYHKKDLDKEKMLNQEKLNLALKELGYGNFRELPTIDQRLLRGETNAVVYSDRVSLTDCKIIILALIRAGFNIQHVYRTEKRPTHHLIQILRNAYEHTPDTTSIVTVDEVVKAKSIEEVAQKHPQLK
jgi:hypothetical protein